MKLYRQTITSAEYSDYDAYYLGLVPPETTLVTGLENSRERVGNFFSALPPEKHDYRYATGKWTIKNVLQHLIDVERIFVYRMLRFARGDGQPLPGFDQDAYGAAVATRGRSLDVMLTEFSAVRRGTILLLAGLTEEELARVGTASGLRTSVRALGFKLVGHDAHHLGVLKERYL